MGDLQNFADTTYVTHRTGDHAKRNELRQMAERDYFPKLKAAPGFVSFYTVEEEDKSGNYVISIWESKAHADAFRKENEGWTKTVDAHSTLHSSSGGEVTSHVTPQT